MSSPDESTNKPTGDDVFVKPATPDLSTAVSISYDPSTRVFCSCLSRSFIGHFVCHCLLLIPLQLPFVYTILMLKMSLFIFPLSILHIAQNNEYWFHVNV